MDAEYVLDSAFELGEITAKEYVVMGHARGGYLQLRKLVDTNRSMPEDFLANTADRVFSKACTADKAHFALLSVPGIEPGLQFFRERCEHVVRRCIQSDLGVWEPAFPGLELIAPSVKRTYVQTEQDVTEGVVRQLLNDQVLGPAHRWRSDLLDLHRACAWLARNGTDPLLKQEALGGAPAYLEFSALVDELKRERAKAAAARERVNRDLRSRARAAVKKATKLFEGLGQRDNLSLFVSGQEVVLSHPDSLFKFVVKPLAEPGWLEARTMQGRSHTPYELQLLTKDDVHLARLCVYFNDTPVLDQLLALSLFVTSGEEEKLLNKANWFAHGDWAPEVEERVLSRHPGLLEKLPRERKAAAEGADTTGTGLADRIRLPPAFEREQTHWEPYRGRVQQWVQTWLEPVTAQLSAMRGELALMSPLAEQLQALQSLRGERMRRAVLRLRE